MKELMIIYQEVNNAFGIDIKTKCRKTIYIVARYCFYSFAKKTTLYKDDVISEFVGYDRTTLLNAMKKRSVYENQYPEYKHMFVDFYFYMKQRSDEISMDEMVKMTTKEFEIKTLKRKLKLAELNLSQTRHRLKNATSALPKEILNLLNISSKDEIDSFIKYKVTPTLIMKASQDKRLLKFNPRGKKLTA